ncbi:glycoprotein Xg-like isoform X20 [Rattus norvegicus]|uniref:glycoprotein Xg-like isoform X20 n=1 Tax=Rattus norvegicus TaxID=10116 RepID=UPI00191754F6|nr:glycoprotein Xg-like isoform X15 [Rattus norvegicus]
MNLKPYPLPEPGAYADPVVPTPPAMATSRRDPRASPASRLPLPLLLFLGVLVRVRGDNGGDFDLADALEEPGPTTPRPSSGLYPRLPQDWAHDPHGGGGGGSKCLGLGKDVDPRPRPRPQPRPQPRPPHEDGEGFGGSTPLAAILSPAVSVVVLALLGAGVGFVRSGRGPRWCLGNRGPRESAPV